MSTAPKRSVSQHTRADGSTQTANRLGGKFDEKHGASDGAAAAAFADSAYTEQERTWLSTAKDNGAAYARRQREAGLVWEEAPLSGEWADGVALSQVVAEATDGEEVDNMFGDELADAWEEGYNEQWSPSTFEGLAENPSDADIAKSYEYARSQIQYDSEAGWEKVMGVKARRTDANIAAYEQRLNEAIDASDKHSKLQRDHLSRISQLSAYGRAYDEGIAIDPVAEAHFEEVWANPVRGETYFRDYLDEERRLLSGLENGSVSPGRIIGRTSAYRNPKKVAREYLERSIITAERAIATEGRGYVIFADEADRRVRAAREGVQE